MFSILNPEAPEFYPHFGEVAQDALKKSGKTIQISKGLPSGISYDRFKTFTAFNVITDQFDENIVLQSNRIISTENQCYLLKCNDIEQNIETIVDTNDTIIDRLDTNLDMESGVNYHSYKQTTVASAIQSTAQVSSWNASPVIAKIQMGSATLIGAKNIPRPQLNFKDTIDNSDNLWMPRISDKPNNIKPLSLNVLYNENGEAIGYEHPYKIELDHYQPGPPFIEPSPTPPVLPPPLEQTPLTYIDQESQLDALIEHLMTTQHIAVDVEHHSYRTYQGITCLIQITTEEGGDFIIDTLALREHIHKLNQVFTDPKKIKIFHGADMDVLWLQRDFGVYIVGLFDTFRAAKALELPGLSLKSLLLRYCQVDADKKYQLADWRMRPLPVELISYARQDTHYLLYIFQRMRDELLQKGSQLLYSVYEQSRQVCAVTYTKLVCDEESHLPLLLKSRKKFNSQQMGALKLLYKWRDSQARELDESTAYLLPNHMLLGLAETLPRELEGVHACCSPMPPFVKQNCITIHRMILSCRELPLEPQLYRMPLSISAVLNHERMYQDGIYTLHDYTQLPDYRDDLPVAITMQDSYDFDANTQDVEYTADVTIFKPSDGGGDSTQFVSQLKADAKSFIPPFDRYKRYRTLAQIEELKVFKEKEAKIAALSKGNSLIKDEILSQLVSPQVPEPKQDTEPANKPLEPPIYKQRKRKISAANPEPKTETRKDSKKPEALNESQIKNETQRSTIKNYDYKKADYKKFFNNSDKLNKIKKSNSKFHKK